MENRFVLSPGGRKRRADLSEGGRREKNFHRPFVSAVVLSALAAVDAYGQTYSVPANVSVPYLLASGSDGALWFTRPEASAIGRMTTAGSFTGFSTPTPNSSPAAIAAGPDGALWFIEGASSKIGRITTAGAFTEYPFASGGNNLNDGITTGPDGALWFTEFGDNRIGRITTSGTVTTFNVPTAGSGPSGITTGPDGALWFVETNGNSVGRVTTNGTFTEYPIPGQDSQPVGIAAGPDGALWFTESNGGIGRSTTSGAITEFGVPQVDPYSYEAPSQIVAAPDGALWFTDKPTFGANASGDGALGRITTKGVVSLMGFWDDPVGITVGPDGNIWVVDRGISAADHGGSISRAVLSSVPDTLYLKGGRFAVSAIFQSGGPWSPATAVRLTDDTGYFWFFDPTNTELVTKVLDGCAVNGNYWLFAAGLTNVGVRIFVTDLQNPASGTKLYQNNLGTSFQPVQDTSAFNTCP